MMDAIFTPDTRDVFYAFMGMAFLALTVLPGFRALRFIGAPPLFVLAGALLALSPLALPLVNPLGSGLEAKVVEHATELIVIVSLAGAGLAIDRPASWRCWRIAWRLLAVAMPLTILGVALGGMWLIGLPLASAVLLAASLAPTDPVLASSVQVGRPAEDEEDEVRLGLTAEAGLNDGLAFPFVYLAIALAGIAGTTGEDWLTSWLVYDVAYRVGAALVVGVGIGFALSQIIARIGDAAERSGNEGPERGENAALTVLAAVFIAYGVTELFSGYGFLAVFVAARAGRRFYSNDEELELYTRRPHAASTQFESILLALLLVWFGGILTTDLMTGLTGAEIGLALIVIFVLRPVAGYLSLIGHPLAPVERFAIASFGIRGLGSVFYIAYGQNHAAFAGMDAIWRVAVVTILISIVVHGLSAALVMPRIGRGT